jgi:hypothetical protein
MKRLIFILFFFNVAYSQSYLAKSVNNVNADSSGNITISVGGRVVDTIYKNSAKDSIVFAISGVRYAVQDSIGGGGASLSGLTSATATNTINNTNYKQRWQWNSIGADSAFVLETVSTTAASNLQNVFTAISRGANATSGQTTRTGIFSNTHTGTTSTNIALQLTASGATTNNALNITAGNIQLVSGSFINFLSNTQRIGSLSGFLQYDAGTSQNIMISTSTSPVCVVTTTGSNYLTFAKPSSGTNAIVFNGDYISGSYRGELTYSNVIKTANGQMDFCGNTGQAGGFGSFTPSEILTIKGSTTAALGSVGIGTTSPVASAKLQINSTTMGFLPPRMTTTEINAIVSPAEGLIVYNTTLHELCFYDGTGWRKFSHSNM